MTRLGWRISGALAAGAGVVVAVGATLAAWDHNPQGEFHGATYVNWADLALIGASWFLVVGGALFIAVALLGLVLRGVRHALERRARPTGSANE